MLDWIIGATVAAAAKLGVEMIADEFRARPICPACNDEIHANNESKYLRGVRTPCCDSVIHQGICYEHNIHERWLRSDYFKCPVCSVKTTL